MLLWLQLGYTLVQTSLQERAIAEGQRLAAQGGFDLNVDAYSLVQPLGFYKMYRTGVMATQRMARRVRIQRESYVSLRDASANAVPARHVETFERRRFDLGDSNIFMVSQRETAAEQRCGREPDPGGNAATARSLS